MITLVELKKIDLINLENYTLELHDKFFLHNLEFQIEYPLKYKHQSLYIEMIGRYRKSGRAIVFDGNGSKNGTLDFRFNAVVKSISFSSLVPVEFYLTLYSKQFKEFKSIA